MNRSEDGIEYVVMLLALMLLVGFVILISIIIDGYKRKRKYKRIMNARKERSFFPSKSTKIHWVSLSEESTYRLYIPKENKDS